MTPTKVVWLSQTTLSRRRDDGDGRAGCASASRSLQDPPSDDICYATQNRQVAVKKIAAECDLVIVVGLAQLLELGAPRRGRPRARRARRPTASTTPDEIDEAWLDGVTTVGVTSGASVPEILVREVLD